MGFAPSPVMPAELQRIQLQANATQPQAKPLWEESGNEPVPAILDAGAVQFLDGSFRLGQISRVLTNPQAKVNLKQSEAEIRASVGKILPSLATLQKREQSPHLLSVGCSVEAFKLRCYHIA